jgi:hypothetical protein
LGNTDARQKTRPDPEVYSYGTSQFQLELLRQIACDLKHTFVRTRHIYSELIAGLYLTRVDHAYISSLSFDTFPRVWSFLNDYVRNIKWIISNALSHDEKMLGLFGILWDLQTVDLVLIKFQLIIITHLQLQFRWVTKSYD